ncbi:MFS transporter, OCT family, solute carrier family 22 (organic cation transporter), member 4/5 [Paragonimus westermani]|uniref:MFS transporter, OCT family, solute carrier family 22 (Organic cation transporter), member 4/5 n=1 Tax=Paragonimus westermani TaxID=34504 RepID=A0A5J4NTD9_9TREM|nr:MFS transporter, OCT family, solute carrier family 22 (organic cation transporter), member 4/5 [Paragonimus westermani]
MEFSKNSERTSSLTTDENPQKTSTEPIIIDQLLETEVGTLGIWQWGLVLLGVVSTTASSSFPVFSDSEPMKRCRMDSDTETQVALWNFTYIGQVTGGWVDAEEQNDVNSGCQMYDNWQEHINATLTSTGTSNLTKRLTPCIQGYVYKYKDFQYPGGIVENFDLVCGHSWLLPTGTSLFMIGMMFGYLFGGFWGARFGIKNALIWFSFLELITSGLCSLSNSFWLFTTLRMFIGIGTYGKLCSFNLIILDVTVPRHRSAVNAAYLLGFNVTSRALLSLFAWLFRDWWWLNLAASFHCLFVFSYFFLVPESPRWLLAQNRNLEALRVLQLGRRVNMYFTRQRNEPSQKLQRLERQETRRQSVISVTMVHFDSGAQNTQSKRRLFTSLFSDSKMTKTTLLSTATFFLFAFTFLGSLLYTRRIKESVYLVSFVTAVAGIPGVFIAVLSYRLVRQRKLPLIVTYLALATTLGAGGLYSVLTEPEEDIVLSVTAVIALMFLVTIQCMMFIYIPELYPPDLRAQGFGTAAGIGRLGAALSTFVNRLDEIYKHGIPAIIYAAVAAISGLLTACFINTTGEEVVLISDPAEQSPTECNQEDVPSFDAFERTRF